MIKKIYITTLSMILLTLTFTTATFAWVSMAETNRVDGLGITASTDSNLEFSLDGINYTSKIDATVLENLIKDLAFLDLSTQDGINFISKPNGIKDFVIPNKTYFSVELFVRTTTRYTDVYLVNNVSNQANFDNPPERGTYIISKGVSFRSSVDFLYDIDEIRLAQIPYMYYAKDAMRISIQELNTDNPNDSRLPEQMNVFIFDPSENEHRGYGKPYGAIDYFNTVRYEYIDIPTKIPNTLYALTTFSSPNKYVPDNTNSRIMSLVITDNVDSRNIPYYEGKFKLNIWLEGFDADSFDSVYNDIVKIQLEFQSALPID